MNTVLLVDAESDKKYFPNNAVHDFIVKLNSPMKLSDTSYVYLSSIIYETDTDIQLHVVTDIAEESYVLGERKSCIGTLSLKRSKRGEQLFIRQPIRYRTKQLEVGSIRFRIEPRKNELKTVDVIKKLTLEVVVQHDDQMDQPF